MPRDWRTAELNIPKMLGLSDTAGSFPKLAPEYQTEPDHDIARRLAIAILQRGCRTVIHDDESESFERLTLRD
jgi:hypothetical protein